PLEHQLAVPPGVEREVDDLPVCLLHSWLTELRDRRALERWLPRERGLRYLVGHERLWLARGGARANGRGRRLRGRVVVGHPPRHGTDPERHDDCGHHVPADRRSPPHLLALVRTRFALGTAQRRC